MKFKPFGLGGRQISEIGFGCGGFWGLPVFPDKKAESLLDVAISKGINFFDTGPNYSNGNAEKRLGRIVKSYRNDVIIGTKVGSRLSPKGKRIRDFSPKGMTDSVQQSMKRLQVDHIDLLQLHGPSIRVLGNEETLDTIVSLRNNGDVSCIGLSADSKEAIEGIKLGVFDTLMTTYNLFCHRESEQIVSRASQAGMSVLIKSPLAHAVFTPALYNVSKLSHIWYLLRLVKNYRTDLMKAKRFWFLNSCEDWTAVQLALKYVLSNSFVTCAVIGTTNEGHLLENLEVLDRGQMPREVVNRIRAM